MLPVSVVVLSMLCMPRGGIELDVSGDGEGPAWSPDRWLPCLRTLGEISVRGIVTTRAACAGKITVPKDERRFLRGRWELWT